MIEPYIGTPESETQDNVRAAKALLRNDDTSISWGLGAVDKKIGPPRPGQLVIIGARSGNGKTTFCMNFMQRLHNGLIHRSNGEAYKTCYMGTEMEPPELMLKWAALYLRYDEDMVLSNKWHLLPEKARENVEVYLHCLEMEDDQTWLPRCMSPTITMVLDNIEKAVSWGANVIIFDHLHRMQARSGQDERAALKEAAIALKTAAQQYGILVIVASQLRREEHGVFEKYRPPHLGSFSGSSDIEGNADIALGLYRPLKKMTVKQERAIRNGDLPLDNFIRMNTAALKCVKHRSRGSITDTTVLLTMNGGRVDDYVHEEWEDINKEDQHVENIPTPRTLPNLQEESQLLEASEGEGGRGCDPLDVHMPDLSFDL